LAVENYLKSIRLNAYDSKAFHGLGSAYMGLGRIDDALAAYTKFVELSPDDPEAYKSRGIAYATRSDMGNARADFQKACFLGSKESCEYLERIGR
jgi:Flp pilus assembly protein TadD